MPKQRYTTEEIIHKLREADVLIGPGQTVAHLTVDKIILKEVAEGKF